MMNERDLTLCYRILEKCQQQHWYAGDEQNTVCFGERGTRYEEFVDKQGNLITIDHDPDDHPRKISFACLPATEEQLLLTEQELGFPLPPFLRVLYSRVANGGFGPGYGLIGAIGGFDEAGNIVEMYQYHSARGQLIDLEHYECLLCSDAPLELPDTTWPRSMLYLCDWGEANVSCIDCVTGCVFLVHMGEKYHRYVLETQAFSLQDWWEQWLAKKPREEKPELQNPPFLDDNFDPFADDEILP